MTGHPEVEGGRGTTLKQRIAALDQLGHVMTALGEGAEWPGHSIGLGKTEFDALGASINTAVQANGWATPVNVQHAFASWGNTLKAPLIEEWLSAYPTLRAPRGRELTVGLILAGNVPLVGLHDVLCVWLSGHRAQVKCSAQEPQLLPALMDALAKFDPETTSRIHFADGKLGRVDAVIATGSNNTARYFEHYFGHLPRIVRRSRVSIAVLDGSESEAELEALGEDVFRYFGLGCRNVAKVYVPQDFDVDRLFKGLFPWKDIINHNKYANNYDYTRALWMLDRVPFLENGFVLLKEDMAMASPVATIHYVRYSDLTLLQDTLSVSTDIQCIVGHGQVPFGKAQSPALGDYADGVDTMAFLLNLP